MTPQAVRCGGSPGLASSAGMFYDCCTCRKSPMGGVDKRVVAKIPFLLRGWRRGSVQSHKSPRLQALSRQAAHTFAARSSARRRTGRRTAMRSQKSLGEVHFARPCCTPAHAAASADPAIAPREPAERTFPSPIASDISRISTRMLPSSLAAPRHGGRHGCPRDSEMLVSAARFPAPR